eukprot:3040490-Prymnesium_polylepis.1
MYSASGEHVRDIRTASNVLHASPCRTWTPITAPAARACVRPDARIASSRWASSRREGRSSAESASATRRNQPSCGRADGDSRRMNRTSRTLSRRASAAPPPHGPPAIGAKKHERLASRHAGAEVNHGSSGRSSTRRVRAAHSSGFTS